MRTMRWELSGVHAGEQFIGASGEFLAAVKGLTNKAAIRWLNNALPILAAEASSLCPRSPGNGNCPDSPTGHIADTIEWFVDEQGLYGMYGTNCYGATQGRCYAIYLEMGAQGRTGSHFLENALASVRGIV